MKNKKISVRNTGKEFLGNVKIAESFIARLIGLMFSNSISGFDGLLIKKCNSVHTCFMKYPIDVIFLSKEMKVIKIIRNMKPWRFSLIYFRACQVLEVDKNVSLGLNEGDDLELI